MGLSETLKRRKSRCCHRPELEGRPPPWAAGVSAPCCSAAVPRSQAPFLLYRRKSALLLSLPSHQAAGGEVIKHSALPCEFPLLCCSLWSGSDGNRPWPPASGASCAPEQEGRPRYQCCDVELFNEALIPMAVL